MMVNMDLVHEATDMRILLVIEDALIRWLVLDPFDYISVSSPSIYHPATATRAVDIIMIHERRSKVVDRLPGSRGTSIPLYSARSRSSICKCGARERPSWDLGGDGYI